MNLPNAIRLTTLAASLLTVPAFAGKYDPETLSVKATSLLSAELRKGKYHKVADRVEVVGYMNQYTVESQFGQFVVVGNRELKKLLHEIDALAELEKMTTLSVGTDAAVDAVASTGESLAALVNDPSGTLNNLGTGVSRLFKRTSKTAKAVSNEVSEQVSGDEPESGNENDQDGPSVTSQLASSYLGIGSAQRKIASELKVDPYSTNQILQAELKRVSQISGTVNKLAKIAIPVPSVIGTAASVSDMVWNLSPTDLLIQNEEILRKLGYNEETIQKFFANQHYSPTEQTAFVGAVNSLDSAKGKEVLMLGATQVQTAIEAKFFVRSTLFAQLYHEQIEPVKALLMSPGGSVPVAITQSGDGLVFAPLDHLLWTPEVEGAVMQLAKLMDENGVTDEQLLWVEGNVSDLALNNLKASGWLESSTAFTKLEKLTRE